MFAGTITGVKAVSSKKTGKDWKMIAFTGQENTDGFKGAPVYTAFCDEESPYFGCMSDVVGNTLQYVLVAGKCAICSIEGFDD